MTVQFVEGFGVPGTPEYEAATLAAFKLLTQSWTEAELAAFDVLGELRGGSVARPGTAEFIYRAYMFERDDRLVGLIGAGQHAGPNDEDADSLWICYFVVDKKFRGQIGRALAERALKWCVDNANGRRILTCTENEKMRRVLSRYRWKHIGDRSIVGDNGAPIGASSSVYEYPRS